MSANSPGEGKAIRVPATANLAKWMGKGMTVNIRANEAAMIMNSGTAALERLRDGE